MRPIIKIILIIIILITAGFVIYFIWQKIFQPLKPPIESPTPTSTPIVTPPGADLKLKKLSDVPVFDYALSEAGEIFYFSETGKVLNAKEGSDIEISSQTIDALNSIETAPGNQKVLASFGNPNEPAWGIFDLIDKVWRPLPQEILKATWGAKDTELIALAKNGNKISLNFIDLLKNPPAQKTIIENLKLKDINLLFKAPQTLYLIEKPSAQYLGRLWQLDLKNLTFNLLIRPEPGLMFKWSTDRSLAFKFNSPDNFLILDQNLNPLIPPTFMTLPEKCTFETKNKNIYCFVPDEIPIDVILPDDYLMKHFHSTDDLFVLNRETEITSKILSSGNEIISPIDAKNPQFLNNSLYFINRFDNHLYKLELPEQTKKEEFFIPPPEPLPPTP